MHCDRCHMDRATDDNRRNETGGIPRIRIERLRHRVFCIWRLKDRPKHIGFHSDEGVGGFKIMLDLDSEWSFAPQKPPTLESAGWSPWTTLEAAEDSVWYTIQVYGTLSPAAEPEASVEIVFILFVTAGSRVCHLDSCCMSVARNQTLRHLVFNSQTRQRCRHVLGPRIILWES